MPTLYDDCKQISISDLKRWEYLNANSYSSGVITWSRHGNKTGAISIEVLMETRSGKIGLNYQCNGTPIKYSVELVSIPSNLGKGVVWFFSCPNTGERCRKLHLADTYFYHRSACRGCMYEKQNLSHKNRKMQKAFEKVFGAEEVYEQIYSKHFKKQYNGKPTKRYLKLLKKVKAGQGISELELLLS